MAFKLNRYFTVDIDMGDDQVISLRMVRLKATDLIDYSHETQVLQDRIKDEDGSAITDIYRLNIDLLASQCVGIDGIEDEDGNKVELPNSENDRKELFNMLGVAFINEACTKFAEGIQLSEGK